nr:hypothetical protein KPHV_19030 [Kitasatospora purpeofusca]
MHHRVERMVWGSVEQLAGLFGGQRLEPPRPGRPELDVASNVARDLLFLDSMLQGGLEHGVDIGERERTQHPPTAVTHGAAPLLRQRSLVVGAAGAALAADA